jgi:hypothetical protein
MGWAAFWVIFFTNSFGHPEWILPGANPTTSIYNASVVRRSYVIA